MQRKKAARATTVIQPFSFDDEIDVSQSGLDFLVSKIIRSLSVLQKIHAKVNDTTT